MYRIVTFNCLTAIFDVFPVPFFLGQDEHQVSIVASFRSLFRSALFAPVDTVSAEEEVTDWNVNISSLFPHFELRVSLGRMIERFLCDRN